MRMGGEHQGGRLRRSSIRKRISGMIKVDARQVVAREGDAEIRQQAICARARGRDHTSERFMPISPGRRRAARRRVVGWWEGHALPSHGVTAAQWKTSPGPISRSPRPAAAHQAARSSSASERPVESRGTEPHRNGYRARRPAAAIRPIAETGAQLARNGPSWTPTRAVNRFGRSRCAFCRRSVAP